MIARFYSLFQDSYVQTFDDTKSGNNAFVMTFPMAEIAQHKAHLLADNRRGMGVFFTPNPCKGGRKEENVTAVRWLYADLDDVTEEEMRAKVDAAPIWPHMITRSGRGFHLYWRSDCDKSQFSRVIQGIVCFFGSDPAISSINEVLRLPPFLHVKNLQAPKKVEILYFSDHSPWHIDDMLEAYLAPTKIFQARHGLADDDLAVIKNISILDVLKWLGIDVRRNCIFENGKATSAHINSQGNYINRFSGKPGSGSTIDAVMAYGNMGQIEAIRWLKDKAGIKERSPAATAKQILDMPIVKRKSHKYYTWGTKALTESFAPIKRDTYAMVGAGYGIGKTTFCMNLGMENAKLGHKVLYVSLEMDSEELFDYLARKFAGWTIPEEIYSQVPEQKQAAYDARRRELANIPNFTLRGVRAGADITWEVLVELIRGDWDLIIVDNFNLIAKKSTVSQYDHEGELSKQFLRYTSQMQVPIIVVHHYSQGGAKENVKTGYSLSGSAKIKNDAMRIVLLDRKRPSEDEDALPQTAKEKAAMKVVLDKGRAYDNWVTRTIYFYKGAFRDDYPEEIVPHWQDRI